MDRKSKNGEDGNEMELTEKKNLLNETNDNHNENKPGDLAAVQFIDESQPNDPEQPAHSQVWAHPFLLYLSYWLNELIRTKIRIRTRV